MGISKELRSASNLDKLEDIDNSKLYREGLFQLRDDNEALNNILFDLTNFIYAPFKDYKEYNEFILTSIAQTQSILNNWKILFPQDCNGL